MRERIRFNPERKLCIQIPGLISGGFLPPLPPDDDEAEPTTPHDLPTRTVSIDGTELHYFEFGNGHAVMFVHGSFADYRAWFSQLEPFSCRYRYITYSRRYHHPNRWTDDGARNCTFRHGQDLAALIDKLGAAPATLVGQSSGGLVALHAALACPERVHSLVLSEPFCLSLLKEQAEGAELWRSYEETFYRPAAEKMARGDVEASMTILCDSIMGAGTYAALAPEIRPIVSQNIDELRLEFSNPEFFSPLDSHELRRLAVPVLIAEGDRSPAMFHAINRELLGALPNASKSIFPGVCHVPPLFASDAFNDTVRSFLSRLGVPEREIP